MPIKTYTDIEKKKLIESALDHRYNNRSNWELIATEIDVARSTLTEWRKSDEWKEADARWRRMLRDQARGDTAQMMEDATDPLYQLMMTDKSGYVRYMAATRILDMNHVGEELEENQADQNKELADFLIKAAKQQLDSAELARLTVNPGGMLPTAIQDMNAEYRERKLSEARAIEAEFRTLGSLEETEQENPVQNMEVPDE